MRALCYTLVIFWISNISDISKRIKRRWYRRKQSAVEGGNVEAGSKTPNPSLPLAGIAQIMIFFSQIATSFRLTYQGGSKTGTSTNDIKVDIAIFFNFRFTIIKAICPDNFLTLPQKEFIIFGGQMMSFLHMIFILLISRLIKCFLICVKACTKPSSPNTDIELEGGAVKIINDNPDLSTAGPSYQHSSQGDLLNFNEMLMTSVIKLLKLYFTPVCTVALNLIHCVDINGSFHLFLYGELRCYTHWQIMIFAVLLPSLFLFPISFEICIRMLMKQQLSSLHFTLSLCCPYYAIGMYIRKFVQNRRKMQSTNAIRRANTN